MIECSNLIDAQLWALDLLKKVAVLVCELSRYNQLKILLRANSLIKLLTMSYLNEGFYLKVSGS